MILKISVLVALVIGMAGCTKDSGKSVGCTIESAVSGVVAIAIAQELQCSNQAAIQASVDAAAVKAGICAAPAALAIGKPKGPVDPKSVPVKSVGSDICNAVAGNLIASLATGAIPAEWGCSATNAQASLKDLIAGACGKAFPN